jgi:hypothetical protein
MMKILNYSFIWRLVNERGLFFLFTRFDNVQFREKGCGTLQFGWTGRRNLTAADWTRPGIDRSRRIWCRWAARLGGEWTEAGTRPSLSTHEKRQSWKSGTRRPRTRKSLRIKSTHPSRRFLAEQSAPKYLVHGMYHRSIRSFQPSVRVLVCRAPLL